MIQQADTNNTEYTSNPKDITILGNEVTSLLDSFGDLNPFHRFEEMRVFFKKPIAVSPGSLSTSLSLEETIRSIKEKYPRLNLEKLTLAKAEVHFKGPIVLTTQENQAIPHNQIKLQSKIKKNKNTLTSKPLINIQKFDRYETAFGPETTIQMTTKKEQFNHTLESHFINPYTGVQLSKFQRYKNAIQTIYGSAIFAELPHLQAFCANASAASFFPELGRAGGHCQPRRAAADDTYIEIITGHG